MTLVKSANEWSNVYAGDNDTRNKRQGYSYFTMTHLIKRHYFIYKNANVNWISSSANVNIQSASSLRKRHYWFNSLTPFKNVNKLSVIIKYFCSSSNLLGYWRICCVKFIWAVKNILIYHSWLSYFIWRWLVAGAINHSICYFNCWRMHFQMVRHYQSLITKLERVMRD